MDRVHFLRPVRVGSLVVIQAQVNFVAHTSMEVGVRVFVEDLRTKERHQTTRAYVTMVAVDAEGKPTPVRPWSWRATRIAGATPRPSSAGPCA
jgi:acyl-CoA hydrolase